MARMHAAQQGAAASVGDFFDQLSSEYDQSIRRLIPQYQEIFETLIGYSFLGRSKPLNVLELGSGSGNLSLYIAHLFPQARLTLVDLSHEMIEQAKVKLAAHLDRVTFEQSGFLEARLPDSEFDWVVSSFALHHLLDPDKQMLYRQIFRWLKPGGIFRIADATTILPTEPGDAYLLSTWQDMAKSAGATDEECRLWMEHVRQHDHPASLMEHFLWLRDTGFTEIDCYWKKLHFTIFGAQKPGV